MPPRPARFSRSTKAAKPAAVTPAVEGVEQQQHHQCASEQHRQHSRKCSVEVVITPSKKRRVVPASNALDHVDAQNVMVTPTKTSKTLASSEINFLPTPPVTPTISVSEHEEGQDSPDLRTPSSAASSSSIRMTSPSPSPSSYNANIYAKARSLLRLSAHGEQNSEAGPSSSKSNRLVGRKAEREQLDAFLHSQFPFLSERATSEEDVIVEEHTRRAKAMYISGSPGTGKTALVHSILEELKFERDSSKGQNVRMSLLNCTTVPKPDDIWTRLAEELDLIMPTSSKKGKTKAKWTMESFKEALNDKTRKCKYLVVLDEIDQLLPAAIPSNSTSASTSSSPSSTNVLGALFSIAFDPSSNLVLIGIANALDLTQRYRTVLFGTTEDEIDIDRCDLELLHFRPFQSDEMVAIVKQRLNMLHSHSATASETNNSNTTSSLPLPVILPAALELAAKKVAAVTGDLRSFLSLIRKAVEIFELEQRKRLLELEIPSLSTSSNSNSKDPVSPTKNILAYRNRKRKLGLVEGEDEEKIEDPLLKFDAITAPKLSPAHILKATRLVSLVSSSSANNGTGSHASGINSSAGSLSTSSSSSNNLLQNKITELNLHQRLALTSFLILLARRISSKVLTWAMINSDQSSFSNNQNIDIDMEASSIPNGGAKPSELHSLYKIILEKEDLIHPVSSSEFSDLLSGLHTRGLVGLEREMSRFNSGNNNSGGSGSLAPPMMRRTSSSSSISSIGAGSSGRASRSPSPNTAAKNGAHAPLYLLYPFTSLHSVLSSPSLSNPTANSNAPKATEASTICSNLLFKESKRFKRISKMNKELEISDKEKELAPRSGFNGNGLNSINENKIKGGRGYVGNKDLKSKHDELEEEEEEGQDDDHEKIQKEQEEQDEVDNNDDKDDSW